MHACRQKRRNGGLVAHRIRVEIGGRTVAVDGRDVRAWAGLSAPPDADDPQWVRQAEAYLEAHPRPAEDTQAGIAAAQRLALLRRLAAGPATRGELLEAMRGAGWVAGDDLENRLRDLRASDRRAGNPRAGLQVCAQGERYWLAEPFPLLAEADRHALGFAKAMIDRLASPLAASASRALERLVPGLAAAPGARATAVWRAKERDYERFEAALREGRAVRVRYFSLNSGRERTYQLVPVEYVAVGANVKAVCVEVDEFGRRAGDDKQFALDRLLAVEELPGRPATPPEDLQLARSNIELVVTDGLYQVMRERNVFGIADERAVQSEYDDSWRVAGSFPVALAWDVMEQLCAWSGSVQVHRPLWLVNAVVRRLRAGLRVMEQGAEFELVKPEPARAFSTQGDAVVSETAVPAPDAPRKLLPPRARLE